MKKTGIIFLVMLTGLALLDALSGDVKGVLLNAGLGLCWIPFIVKKEEG